MYLRQFLRFSSQRVRGANAAISDATGASGRSAVWGPSADHAVDEHLKYCKCASAASLRWLVTRIPRSCRSRERGVEHHRQHEIDQQPVGGLVLVALTMRLGTDLMTDHNNMAPAANPSASGSCTTISATGTAPAGSIKPKTVPISTTKKRPECTFLKHQLRPPIFRLRCPLPA